MSLINEKVLVKTPYNPISGYGKDGLFIVETLDKMGADVYVEPDNVGVPLPVRAAELLTKPYATHFDTALHHAYPGALGFPSQMPMHANKLVAWTMYEFLGFGDSEMALRLDERLSSFDLLLAYDEVSKHTLSSYFDVDRIHILQGGYDADNWRPKGDEIDSRDWYGTFRFCMNGTMNQRKNPFAAIDAFKELKDEYGDDFDAELHLKTTSMVLHPRMEQWIPGLKIHYAAWTDKQIKNLYLNCHVLIAPSWGEGKNLPALEAQTTGCVAMVSDFGGHKQWASSEFAYLIPGVIEEHAPEQGSFRVDKDVLRDMMWDAYSNRAETKHKGELASRIIPAQCDWSVVMERLRFILDELEPKPRPKIAQ